MIDSVNGLSLSSPGSGEAKQGEDAMAQIAQILSSHLESLQWIDNAVHEVESKVTEVEKGVREAGATNSLGGGNKSRGFGLNR
jgi:nuclear pore complex protein Nup62